MPSPLHSVLLSLPPETAHRAAVTAVRHGLVPPQPRIDDPRLAMRVAGIDVPNAIGLAAGFDKNAETLPHIFAQGFGFVECGTVTPRPQPGNPKPRIFRLPEQRAVVNRLGFNNDGLEPFVQRLAAYRGGGIVGANIGKNKDSDDAIADYRAGLRRVYGYASYITVNISSPNTAGLRDLQAQDALGSLIAAVHAEREAMMGQGNPYKPVFVKIAPDLDPAQKEAIAALALQHRLDGLIVSNTTTSRPFPVADALREGGLSGAPLFELSTRALADMYRLTQGKVPLIGVGGIASAQDAYAKITAGASLVQLYTALVYEGFGLVTRIQRGLLTLLERDGLAHLREAVGSAV